MFYNILDLKISVYPFLSKFTFYDYNLPFMWHVSGPPESPVQESVPPSNPAHIISEKLNTLLMLRLSNYVHNTINAIKWENRIDIDI